MKIGKSIKYLGITTLFVFSFHFSTHEILAESIAEEDESAPEVSEEEAEQGNEEASEEVTEESAEVDETVPEEEPNDAEEDSQEADATESVEDEQQESTEEVEQQEVKAAAAKTTSDSPFQKGKRHKDTVVIKERLAILGYWDSSNPTTLYGSQTEAAVKEFQKAQKLSVTGIVDDSTWSTLERLATGPLRNPMYREDAIPLKEKLELLGFGSFAKTDYYASKTEKAVRDFQAYFGLGVDGIAGNNTISKLNSEASTPLQSGKRDDKTVQLKEYLHTLGYWDSKSGTTLYGSQTTKAVKEFQKDFGLKASGVADSKTWAKLKQEATGPLKNPMYRDDAKTVKADLQRLGFGSFTLTDYFGSQTEKAVRDFQKQYGLTVNGIVNDATKKKLSEAANVPFRKGVRHKDTVKLKEMLYVVGLWDSKSGTTLYGSQTAKAVKEFQSAQKLAVTGIADPTTWSRLESAATGPLKNPMYRDDVVSLKKDLVKLGFGDFAFTDYYGSQTAKAVKQFQSYYGLSADGVVGKGTTSKMESIINSPYQKGKSASKISDYKKMLRNLGYSKGITTTKYFGATTEKRVKEFQKDNGLRVNGILDEVTIKALEDLEVDNVIYRETSYNISLNDQLNKQLSLNPPPQTDKYANSPAYVKTADASFYTGGAITGSRVNVRTAPDTSKNNVAATLAKGTQFEYVKNVKGTSVSGSTTWYEIKYKGDTLYVHSSLASKNKTIAKMKSSTTVYASKSTSGHVFYKLSKGSEATVESKGSTWTQINGKTWRNAKASEVKQYLDPAKQDEFQHLVLSESVRLPGSEISKVLTGKGVLEGQGNAFVKAAETHNVNEIYLISHALLETGHGKSALAKGIEVGKNSSGKPVLVTSSNRSSLSNIKKVHNMFGIGAADSDAKRLGAIKAYNEGWDTVEKAIVGGAKFIGERYIHNQYNQDTIYKMRWNPANPGYPQYATDMAWASKQISNIKSMYGQLNNPRLVFDIPEYK
ncbi:peptidoglycan-binding protein [Gracilibacillus sp. S3-1-1]|uniref:Peptidoglycan-binding protein n=1 Tax=Gracilibacillus pellucidus TaxID=3095368 RepID=A0ACC6M897_9BACI|nr:peptidoglycan-binding protein [Gracilibacillus sp. S3-1-1]MDX8047101.1 peptidoglycan-binding protein [Gracilibacillus sp. S3-1-1]